ATYSPRYPRRDRASPIRPTWARKIGQRPSWWASVNSGGSGGMSWQDRMNRAIAWIELHLRDAIEWDVAAREAYCSPFHFLRMFEVITGITAGEYVRRRRLSLATMDLVTGDAKIIDLALRYGYDSP